LTPVDMDSLKGRLTAIEAETRANDPKALRRRIIELEQELTKAAPAGIAPAEHKRMMRASYQNGISAGRAHIVGILREVHAASEKAIKEAQRLADLAFDEAQAMQPNPVNVIVPARRVIDAKTGADITGQPHVRMPVMSRIRREQNETINGALPRGERAVLIAAAQHPNGVTRTQLTVLTGYKRSSRDAYIQRLKERGLIYIDGDRVKDTDDGREALGSDFTPLPTGAALREHVLRTLPEGERKVLDILIQQYPDHVPRGAIEEATGYKRSSRDAYLQRLNARELVHITGGGATASADLFD